MGNPLAIGAICAVIVFGRLVFSFAAYNRRRGTEALRWVRSACAGEGRVLDSQWLNSSRLHARSRTSPSRNLENVNVTHQQISRPRPLPIHWILSRWHNQKETLTFEADLGGSPSLHREVTLIDGRRQP